MCCQVEDTEHTHAIRLEVLLVSKLSPSFKRGQGFLGQVECITISVDPVCLPATMAAAHCVCVPNCSRLATHGIKMASGRSRLGEK